MFFFLHSPPLFMELSTAQKRSKQIKKKKEEVAKGDQPKHEAGLCCQSAARQREETVWERWNTKRGCR